MKKSLIIILAIIIASCTAFAAKYKVNTQGVVKTNSGQTVNTTVPQSTYNVYNAQNYISSNQVNTGNIQTIEIVMDYSGSMSNWIGEAKRAMSAIIAQIPPSTRVGFRVFGHDLGGKNPSTKAVLAEVKKIVKKNGRYQVQTTTPAVGTTCGYCSATQQVCGLLPANSNAILYGMNSVNIGGATPMVYALDRAIYEDFSKLDMVSPKKIVLITDGGENCGGDPCAYAKQLVLKRNDIQVDVVLVSNWFDSKLACLANETGGKLYRVNNLSDFTTVVTKSMKTNSKQAAENQTQQYEYYGN